MGGLEILRALSGHAVCGGESHLTSACFERSRETADGVGGERTFPPIRHPGLDPGSRFLPSARLSQGSGTPDQVRGDGKLMTAHGHFRHSEFVHAAQPLFDSARNERRLDHSRSAFIAKTVSWG
ncbi:hypothetical protein EWH08_16340 [Sphingobium indicum]|uniref:Uncharacterized protein n=1 Tax=Sphingobium indicum TaxID=332055 RepID=A0A4V1W9D2_9SPHN|nr:hypothetical protein EWH08_16340 [Sphingobium indicum]